MRMQPYDISGIPDMVEEPCVVIEHKEHVDLQAQVDRHDLETDDYIHTHQYGEFIDRSGCGDRQIDGALTSGTSLQ